MKSDKPVILVVEDNKLIRMLTVDVLIHYGFQVIDVETADDAVRILEIHTDIHLVFTDVQMPGAMDGINLCHYIRQRWPAIKLIVASGSILDGRRLPVGTVFFAKPYNQDAVVKNIFSSLS